MKRQKNTPLPTNPLLWRSADVIARQIELKSQEERLTRQQVWKHVRGGAMCPLAVDLIVRHLTQLKK